MKLVPDKNNNKHPNPTRSKTYEHIHQLTFKKIHIVIQKNLHTTIGKKIQSISTLSSFFSAKPNSRRRFKMSSSTNLRCIFISEICSFRYSSWSCSFSEISTSNDLVDILVAAAGASEILRLLADGPSDKELFWLPISGVVVLSTISVSSSRPCSLLTPFVSVKLIRALDSSSSSSSMFFSRNVDMS